MRVNANAVLRSWTLLSAFGGSYAPDNIYIYIPIARAGRVHNHEPRAKALGNYSATDYKIPKLTFVFIEFLRQYDACY